MKLFGKIESVQAIEAPKDSAQIDTSAKNEQEKLLE